jgi:long-chain acyl-CoA synthetase
MNLAAMIEGHASAATALTAGDEVVTYGQLRERTAALRGRLAAFGVGPGDRVAIVSGNYPSFAVAYLAILGSGAVAVPLNPGSPPPELTRELTAVGAEVIVVGPGGLDTVGSVDRASVGIRHVLAADVAAGDGAGDEEAPLVPRESDDLAVLMFTAGTAGFPKAAKLTHGNLLANLDQIQRHPGRAIEASDVCLGVLPLFHIFGLNVVLGLALHYGASVALVEHFHATPSLELMAREGVTLVAGSPTMYAAWAKAPDVETDRLVGAFAKVRLATSGAAPLSEEVAEAFQRRSGVAIHQGYGLTEASPVVTSSLLDRPPRWGSVGVPLPGLDVRLVDDEGEDALVGDPGEIWVRGPNVFAGYWEEDEATRGALTDDGWLRTGDVAIAGDDGELYLVDRAKDLIIVSGFNVYPAEVEEVLLHAPGVVEAVVIGRPDDRTGETVVAYVVVDDPDHPPASADLVAWCQSSLARYKCPTQVTVVASLPHGLGGKLLRRAIRDGAGPVDGG